MTELRQIATALKELSEGTPWHGPSLDQTLKGITAAQAARRPIPGAHSIWELVLHLDGWHGVVIDRAKGRAIEEPQAGDFPIPAQPTEESWQQQLTRLRENLARMISLIEKLDEGQLDQNVAGESYTLRFMLRGTIDHLVYHSGQIGLLKKAV